MAVVGIIAEYNPFHYGHGFQMEAVRRKYPAAYIVIAMSGSFTQRGAPCILDKWTRACHAVAGGADLVLELPFVYACRSAQDFARGGVSLLSSLGIVTHLAFGTEAEGTSLLSELAAQIDTDPVQMQLREYLGQGCSYAGALTRALTRDTVVSEDLLRAPNNILAIEYLRALQSLAPQILPLGIQRASAQHCDAQLHAGITSASSIRHALRGAPPSWDRIKQSVLPCTLHDLKEAYMQGMPQITLTFLRRHLQNAIRRAGSPALSFTCSCASRKLMQQNSMRTARYTFVLLRSMHAGANSCVRSKVHLRSPSSRARRII